MIQTVLAVDPGREKCGLALVQRDPSGCCRLLLRAILSPQDVPGQVKAWEEEPGFDLLVLGRGSGGREVGRELRELRGGRGVLVVDETGTTIAARERYWAHNPRRGWRLLLPATLQTPPEPIDDFAALVIAERVLFEGRPSACRD